MDLTTLLDRMKLDHLAAQLDGICEHAAQGAYSTHPDQLFHRKVIGCSTAS